MDKFTRTFFPPSRIDLAHESDLSIGVLRIRPSRREVEARGTTRVLQRRVMQVLVALARSTTAVVSQQELIARCWGGLSVTDDAIGRCVAQLRRLAASWPEPPFEIETIAGVGYRFEAKGALAPLLPRPSSKISVAVTPFLGSEPEQVYFADGIVEEVVASLARFKTLHVIWAGGSVVSNGQTLSPTAAARELGVDYLVDGSVRREGGRLRITVHLIDGRAGAELWAERFDGEAAELFALQDRVAERVAGAIDPVTQEVGITAAIRRPTDSLDSYDLYLRSLALFRRSRKDDMLASIELLERSIAIDPHFALALAQSAVCHRQVVDHEWADDLELFRRRGLDYAERALAVAPDDVKTVAMAAASLPGLEGGMDRALALADRAITLNPASTFAWLISGSVRLRNGEPDLAAIHLETALRLDPISPMGGFATMYLALCRFQQRRFDEALTLFGTTALRMPISYAILAALYGHLGRPETARAALTTFEGLSAGSIDKFARLWFPTDDYRQLFLDGLRGLAAPDAG